MSDIPPQPVSWLSEITAPMPSISITFLAMDKHRYPGLKLEHAELLITDGKTFAVLKAYDAAEVNTVMNIPVPCVCDGIKLKVQACPTKYIREGLSTWDIVATADAKVDPSAAQIVAPKWPFVPLDDLEKYFHKNVDVQGYVTAAPTPKPNGDRMLQELELMSLSGCESRLTVWDTLISKNFKPGDVIKVTGAFVKTWQRQLVMGYCLSADRVSDPDVFAEYSAWAAKHQVLRKVKRSLGQGTSQMSQAQLHLLGDKLEAEICETVTGVEISPYDGCREHRKNMMTFNGRGFCTKCDATVEAKKCHFAKITIAGDHEQRAFDGQLESLLEKHGVECAAAEAAGLIEEKVKNLVLGKICQMAIKKTKNDMRQDVINIEDWAVVAEQDAKQGSPAKQPK